MRHAVIIMAQGLNTRWLEGDPSAHGLPLSKHLLPICGIPNLARTVRMLHGQATVIGWPEYAKIVGPANLVTLAEPGMLAGAMAQVRGLWGTDRTTFLLGDVIWSRASLAEALESSGDYRMIVRESTNLGRLSSERYSLSFVAKLYPRVEGFLASVYNTGRLLDLRRWLPEAIPSGMSNRVARLSNSMPIRECKDWTDDVDTVAEWLQFGPTLQALANDVA